MPQTAAKPKKRKLNLKLRGKLDRDRLIALDAIFGPRPGDLWYFNGVPAYFMAGVLDATSEYYLVLFDLNKFREIFQADITSVDPSSLDQKKLERCIVEASTKFYMELFRNQLKSGCIVEHLCAEETPIDLYTIFGKDPNLFDQFDIRLKWLLNRTTHLYGVFNLVSFHDWPLHRVGGMELRALSNKDVHLLDKLTHPEPGDTWGSSTELVCSVVDVKKDKDGDVWVLLLELDDLDYDRHTKTYHRLYNLDKSEFTSWDKKAILSRVRQLHLYEFGEYIFSLGSNTALPVWSQVLYGLSVAKADSKQAGRAMEVIELVKNESVFLRGGGKRARSR